MMQCRFIMEKGKEMKTNLSSKIILALLLLSMLTLLPTVRAVPAHDVAVTAVMPFKTLCECTNSPFHVVYRNASVNINATVKNLGSNAEEVNVTAKYDGTLIQWQTVSLAVDEEENVTFTWDTHGVAYANHTITVEAQITGDENPGDNTKGDWIVVTRLGDQDGNLEMEAEDLWYLCAYFITYYKIDETYISEMIPYDFDENCVIDEDDIWAFQDSWFSYFTSL